MTLRGQAMPMQQRLCGQTTGEPCLQTGKSGRYLRSRFVLDFLDQDLGSAATSRSDPSVLKTFLALFPFQ